MRRGGAAAQEAEMTLGRLDMVADELTGLFGQAVPMRALPLGAYERMRWLALIPLMRFTAKQYAAPGFGNVFAMHTRAMGRMQLATLVFTPNCGTNVPLLLVDVMAFGKKRAAFVEYYDCTRSGAAAPELADLAARCSGLPDYPEKPAWYVAERTPYSLIKGGQDADALIALLRDSVSAYAALAKAATEADAENLTGLALLVERMVREGNPSSAAMEKVLGKSGAEAFFRNAVMPKEYRHIQTEKE